MKEYLLDILRYEVSPLQLLESLMIVIWFGILVTAEVYIYEWQFWALMFVTIIIKNIGKRQVVEEIHYEQKANSDGA